MHITRVEPIVVGIPEYADIVMVVVHTDEGVSGVGEATLEGQADAVLTVLGTLAREVAGADAARIQHLWQSLYRDPFWRPGPIRLSAMSGIEQALWDIKGKVAGLPVFDLLGGACRDELRLYANSPVGATPQELAESAVAIVERGFDAMKLAAPDATLPLDTPGSLRAAVARCEAIRAAVGDDIALGVDLHGRLSPAMAIAFAHAVADLGIWFLEEPTPPEALPSIADVARATSIPLAAGERLLTKWAFPRRPELRPPRARRHPPLVVLGPRDAGSRVRRRQVAGAVGAGARRRVEPRSLRRASATRLAASDLPPSRRSGCGLVSMCSGITPGARAETGAS